MQVTALLRGLALLAFAAAFIGCEGYSESRATDRCDVDRTARGMSFNADSYDQCIQCMEECGDECQPQNTSPESYACVEDSG